VLCFTFLLFVSSTVSYAHKIIRYIPPCVTAGQSAAIGTVIVVGDPSTWYHWQYRVNAPGTAPGSWTFLDGNAAGTPVNNTINGVVFAVSNANRLTAIQDFAYDLVIANSTTALNNVEFRVAMGAGADPQLVLTPVWGAEDQSLNEVKTVRIRVRPADETCFTNCADNLLVLNPPNTLNTSIDDYYGGFESISNFGGTNPNGSSITAQTDYINFVTSFPPNVNHYGIVNNPYAMIYLANTFAPHSGRDMLVINQSSNTTSRMWYKTLVAPVGQYYNGQFTLKVWASKVKAGNTPCFALELKGTNAANVTSVLNTLPVTMSTTPGQPGNAIGDWVQYTLTFSVPGNIYNKLETSIRGNCVTESNFALDDICVVAPASGVLPVTLSGLSAIYTDGVTHLQWSTEQEINSSNFVIERSSDAVNYKPIGSVNAAGFSSRRLTYKFDDVKVDAGISYYRLRMVDRDASNKLSNTVSVNVKIKGQFLTGVYPSPFADKLSISISSETAAKAVVKIYDVVGRVVINQNAVINNGVTIITISDLGKLSKGFYVVELTTADKRYTERIVK
jgi:Secretion system C-terminal sorting domain